MIALILFAMVLLVFAVGAWLRSPTRTHQLASESRQFAAAERAVATADAEINHLMRVHEITAEYERQMIAEGRGKELARQREETSRDIAEQTRITQISVALKMARNQRVQVTPRQVLALRAERDQLIECRRALARSRATEELAALRGEYEAAVDNPRGRKLLRSLIRNAEKGLARIDSTAWDPEMD